MLFLHLLIVNHPEVLSWGVVCCTNVLWVVGYANSVDIIVMRISKIFTNYIMLFLMSVLKYHWHFPPQISYLEKDTHCWFRRFPEHLELNLGSLKNVKCASVLLCLCSVLQYAESVSAGAGPAAARQTELPAAAHTVPCLWSQHVVPANITRASVVGFSHSPDTPYGYVAKIMGHSAELVAPSRPAQEHEKKREAKSNAAAAGGRGGGGRCRG